MMAAEAPPISRTYRKRMGFEMWQSQIRKGSLSLAVLASLWDGPLDGAEISSRLEDTAGIAVIQGVLYPILRRLRRAQWIEIKWVEIEAGHPRQLFCLTESGRESARELSTLWAKYAHGMDRMVGRLSQPNHSGR
jgi:PadR family transcriptional regulator, regulatory protein PadR